MRTIAFATFLAAAGCAGTLAPSSTTTARVVIHAPGGGDGAPPAVTVASTQWLGGGPVQANVLAGSDGNTYVGFWVTAPGQSERVAVRAPMDVALVIDVSGSMAGDKIVNARAAAASFIESMRDGDIVAVYAFSDQAFEIAAPTAIQPGTRADLIGRVNGLQPVGGTNMYAGLQAGESRLAQAPPTHPVRRVVLISDGMANIGPSSPEELGLLAAQGTESGAQVTAIGVGLDYDERTLGALAVRSSGRLYHLDAPGQMAQILRNELHLLEATVAANAYLEVVPAPGVELSGVEGLRVDRVGSAVRIPLGSLYAGQQREVLLRARVDAGAPGAHNLGMARLVFSDPARRDAQRHTELSLQYVVTPDAGAVAASVNERVRTIVATHEAAQAQLHAVTQLNQGNATQAVATLDRAEAQLNAAAAASNDEAQRRRLHEAVGRMRTNRASAAAAASPHAAPAAARGGAVRMNADAYRSMGY